MWPTRCLQKEKQGGKTPGESWSHHGRGVTVLERSHNTSVGSFCEDETWFQFKLIVDRTSKNSESEDLQETEEEVVQEK